jgi:hypothetical protein
MSALVVPRQSGSENRAARGRREQSVRGTCATEDVALRRFAGAQIGRTGARPDRNGSDGGRLTLQRRLDDVWEGLHADGAAECPVCEGQMRGRSGARAARCASCGTTLD